MNVRLNTYFCALKRQIVTSTLKFQVPTCAYDTTANAVRVRPREERSDEVSKPASALTHGEPEGCIALKPFAHLNRSTRTRWSERHAVRDLHESVKACRCWRCGGVSRRRQHERQASACAPDVRPLLLSAANTTKLRTTFANGKHATSARFVIVEQRELIFC